MTKNQDYISQLQHDNASLRATLARMRSGIANALFLMEEQARWMRSQERCEIDKATKFLRELPGMAEYMKMVK